MNRKQWLITAFSLLLMFYLLADLRFIRLAEANFLPVPKPQPAFTILSDGSVDPPIAPIQRNGEIYTLTDDIIGCTIAVERNNIILDGGDYTLQGNGNSTGIFIRNQNGVTVRNMKIGNHLRGIWLLTDIYIDESMGNHIVSDNNISNNNYGICLDYSTNNTLRNNHMNDNTHSLHFTYSPLVPSITSFVHDVDASNTVNGKPVYYWVNQQNKDVPSDAGYVGLINCTTMLVQNLDLTSNGQAVLLVSTTYSKISGNNLTNNGDQGIYLYESSNNRISENKITNNGNSGITLYYSSNNIISENTITENNQDGIYQFDSSHNSISGNNITRNNQGINIYSGGANNIIAGNTIMKNTKYGVSLNWSDNNNFIYENCIEKNGNGIFVKESSNNRIIGNTIKENNFWGIRLEGSQRNNIIYHNYFIDNNVGEGLQVSIPGLWEPGVWEPGNPNVWDDGEKGNYWSDYFTRYTNATEIGSTGIGDTPFYINPNNMDYYPVIKDDVVPEFPVLIPMLLTLNVLAASIIFYKRRLHRNFRN